MSHSQNRLVAMDVLRGFALLGILLMNIQSFAMPGAAYLNPTAYGNFVGIDQWVWSISHVLADQKFMSLFSMLFGAGVLLFCQNAEQKSGSALKLHYTRTFWLLIFGLIHGYLFWYGDILYAYAMCGFVIYWMRNKSIRFLCITALLLLSVSSLYNLLLGVSIDQFPKDALNELNAVWKPNQTEIGRELNAYLGSFSGALSYRAEETLFMQTYVFFSMFVWRATAMMLLGMALFKSGFFHLQWNTKRYTQVLAVCLPLGFLIIGTGLSTQFEHDFSLNYSMFIGSQFNYWGSILVALGYASGVILMVKSGMAQSLQHRFAAIGKTAFSNYILHTLVFTTIFNGYGLGLFGAVDRWQQLIMVGGMWLVQLWVSPLWLKHYRYGPLEWCWRSLTYGKSQKMKR